MATRGVVWAGAVMTLVAAGVLFPAASAPGNVALTRVSSDPFTNANSQHATELEPDTFAFGSTVVGAFQVGRFFDGGASDIGLSRSGHRGRAWGRPGLLRGPDSPPRPAGTP